MFDIGPGCLLWQLLIKIQYICPFSPSPHLSSSCFPSILSPPTPHLDHRELSSGGLEEDINSPSRSRQGLHQKLISHHFTRSQHYACIITPGFSEFISRNPPVPTPSIVDLFCTMSGSEEKNHSVDPRLRVGGCGEWEGRKTVSTALNMKWCHYVKL